MNSKRVLTTMAFVSLACWAMVVPSCRDKGGPNKKVIVLGFDGMDPRLCERLMDAGQLPNLNKMRKAGGYRRLGTSIPPQSPVAWSSFITGANPGVHGVFDFIHRNPERQFAPYYSSAQTVESDEGWNVGRFRIPLTFWPFNHTAAKTLLRRGGVPFWDYLDEAGVPVHMYDIPANYPPSESHHGHMCCLSGMGTPDLLGSFGTYQYFSQDTTRPKGPETESGGMRKPLVFKNNAATATLIGPENTYLKKPIPSRVTFELYRHPHEPTARIDLQGQTVILKEGEWSDWCHVDFELEMPPFLPNNHAKGICRFYVQEVRPNFRLYVTPINIDPSDPGDQRITEPQGWITEIAAELGLFYTSGFAEDHKALSNKVFADHEFHTQADYVLAERMNLLRYAIDHYDDGLLFFYFSSTDLQAHLFWWDSDRKHPLRSAGKAREYHGVVEDLYKRMDSVVGDVVARFGDDALILVMSDHGFCEFRRRFDLNNWLRDKGYVRPANCRSLLMGVDWSRTRAYGLGLNGLYLNLAGRERDGIVDPSRRDALLEKISQELLAVRDPLDGAPVIAAVYRSDEVYSGPNVSKAPDLIVGYHRGYRVAWGSILGFISEETIADNREAWTADHCVAADLVPGVVFSNRPIPHDEPSLIDMAPTILEEFGLTPPETMKGVSLFKRLTRIAAADGAPKE
ncbi:MAG: alkaline phosphatase family protein [Phycisphaerae bacterium]